MYATFPVRHKRLHFLKYLKNCLTKLSLRNNCHKQFVSLLKKIDALGLLPTRSELQSFSRVRGILGLMHKK